MLFSLARWILALSCQTTNYYYEKLTKHEFPIGLSTAKCRVSTPTYTVSSSRVSFNLQLRESLLVDDGNFFAPGDQVRFDGSYSLAELKGKKINMRTCIFRVLWYWDYVEKLLRGSKSMSSRNPILVGNYGNNVLIWNSC